MLTWLAQTALLMTGIGCLIFSSGWISITSQRDMNRIWVKYGYVEVDGIKYDLIKRK